MASQANVAPCRHLMTPLDEILRTHLLLALTRNPPPNDIETELFALPAREGGLGIRIPSEQANHEHQSSLCITSSLHNGITNQESVYSYEIISDQVNSKATVRQQNKEKTTKDMAKLTELFTADMQRSVNLHSKRKGLVILANSAAT